MSFNGSLGQPVRPSAVVSGNSNVSTARPQALASHAGEEPARIRAAIARSSLFAALPIPAIEDLTARVVVRRVGANVTVVSQDETSDAVYMIMAGRVKVAISGDNGREVTLAVLRPGDSFGEMSMFDQAPRSASCTTLEPTTMLVLSRDEVMKHLAAHPRTAMNLLTEMARRLRKADQAIAQLALCDVNERLVLRLVGLAREEGTNSPDGVVVRRRPTQQELANRVGSCRETISRAYNQLARDGLIIARGRSLVVTPALLERAERRKAA